MAVGKRVKSLVAVLVLAVSTLGPAAPAAAVPPRGSATITSARDLLAGQQHLITFSVTNAAGSLVAPGETVNWVRVGPRFIDAGLFVAGGEAAGDAGENWTPTVVSKTNDVIFTGGTMEPGDTLAVTVVANAERPPADFAVNWLVSVSSDDGDTLRDQADNGLTTTLRVLSLDTVSVTGPSGEIGRAHV